MIMSPSLRKVALTAHVTSSIGWFGAVAVFLALALAGLFSQDPELMRAAYLVMGVTTWGVIVPLALVSLLTGVVSSLFTRWGLVPLLLGAAETRDHRACHAHLTGSHAAY